MDNYVSNNQQLIMTTAKLIKLGMLITVMITIGYICVYATINA